MGEALGSRLKGGEIIELISDLGGGKTTLTRGISRGIGSNNHVSSPTFKICNVYEGKKLRIYHYDFYRLSEPGLIEHELQDAFADSEAVIVVEWPDIIENILLKERLTINIRNSGEQSRKIVYNYPASLSYLVE